jgi:hypothetical protein
MKPFVFGALGVCSLLLSAAAWADSPATEPVQRYTLVMPPGMIQVRVGARTAICFPDVEASVRKGLVKLAALKRPPTTQPTDLLNSLDAHEKAISEDMGSELNLPKDKFADFLGTTIRPGIQKIADARPKMYVVAATQEQVAAALRKGWHAPLFSYNTLVDQAVFQPTIIIKNSMDDLVVWALLRPDDSPVEIAEATEEAQFDVESSLPEHLSGFALQVIDEGIVGFIEINAIKPLKLPASEQWFGEGVAFALVAKYTSEVAAMPRTMIEDRLAADRPQLLTSASLDLLNGVDPSTIKPELLEWYNNGVSRKASRVIEMLMHKEGDMIVSKILAAVKANPPQDNLALVALIRQVTQVDITNDLLPKITGQ